jgi:hypothetical protein
MCFLGLKLNKIELSCVCLTSSHCLEIPFCKYILLVHIHHWHVIPIQLDLNKSLTGGTSIFILHFIFFLKKGLKLKMQSQLKLTHLTIHPFIHLYKLYSTIPSDHIIAKNKV